MRREAEQDCRVTGNKGRTGEVERVSNGNKNPGEQDWQQRLGEEHTCPRMPFGLT